MKKRWILGGLVAASLVANAGPALASRDRLGGGGTGWEWAGGRAVGVSVDGPKSSNAYELNGTTGSYVFLRGYWDMPVALFSAGFAYRVDAEIADGDGAPRISVVLSNAGGPTGETIFLDPYWCPSAANAKGWATSDFFRTGSSCTIYLNGQGFTGTDASPGPDLVVGTTDDVAATSAWSAAVAAATGTDVYIAFLVSDWEGTSVVDRVRFGGSVLSYFGGNQHFPS